MSSIEKTIEGRYPANKCAPTPMPSPMKRKIDDAFSFASDPLSRLSLSKLVHSEAKLPPIRVAISPELLNLKPDRFDRKKTDIDSISPQTNSPSSGQSGHSARSSSQVFTQWPQDYDVNPNGRRKRKRTTDEQLRVLSRVFDHSPIPTSQQREELARLTGMTPREVQVWFQNRRQSMKKNGGEKPTDVAQALIGLSSQ